jgi:hypothetical protein
MADAKAQGSPFPFNVGLLRKSFEREEADQR